MASIGANVPISGEEYGKLSNRTSGVKLVSATAPPQIAFNQGQITEAQPGRLVEWLGC